MGVKEDFNNLEPSKCLMMGFLVAAFYYFMFLDKGEALVQETDQLRTVIARDSAEIQKINSVLENKAEFEAQIAELEKDFETLLKYLPEDLDINGTSREITRKVEDFKNTLSTIEKVDSKARFAGYPESGLKVVARGEFHSLMEFLASMTELNKVVDFRDLEFDGSFSTDEHSDIKLNLLMSVFSKEGGG